MKFSKKAQMEVMGLVMIVILVAIAMLFTLQFVILKQPTEIKKIYTHSKLSSTILNAMLNTNTECKQIDFRGLLQDCASNSEGSRIYCNILELDSCDFAEVKINEIFDNTLRKWNIAFEFNASLTDINIHEGICAREKQSKIYPIPTDIGVMTLRLDICS